MSAHYVTSIEHKRAINVHVCRYVHTPVGVRDWKLTVKQRKFAK